MPPSTDSKGDPSIVSRAAHHVARGLSLIAKTSNAVGTLVVLGLVLTVDMDVIARGVFNAPFSGSFEVVQFSMVLIVFLQLPDVIRINRLTRSEGILANLAIRYPSVARTIARLIDAVSCVAMAAIAYAIFPEFLETWETEQYFGTPGIFTAPVWPLKLVITFSAVVSAMIFATKVVAGKRRPEHMHLEESGA